MPQDGIREYRHNKRHPRSRWTIGYVGPTDTCICVDGVQFGVDSFGWYVADLIIDSSLSDDTKNRLLDDLLDLAKNDPYGTGVF